MVHLEIRVEISAKVFKPLELSHFINSDKSSVLL